MQADSPVGPAGASSRPPTQWHSGVRKVGEWSGQDQADAGNQGQSGAGPPSAPRRVAVILCHSPVTSLPMPNVYFPHARTPPCPPHPFLNSKWHKC